MFTSFRKEMIVSVLIVAGSSAIFGTGFYFLSKSIAYDTQQIVGDRILITKNGELPGMLAQLKLDSAEASRYGKTMDTLLVSKDQLINFSPWLEGLARVRQIGMNFSFSGSEVVPTDSYPGYINFSLDITGTFDALTGFLKDIELQSTRFLVNLDTFDVVKSDVTYRITVHGKVFFK